MKQPHRARWGFSVGPTGMGGPELGLDDHVKGIEWTVDLILVGDFSIWPTFKEKEKKILIFFFCHSHYFPVVSVCFLFFCFSKFTLAFRIIIWIIGKADSLLFYTVITFSNFIRVVVSKIFTHLSFFLGILLRFVIPSSYCPFMRVW